MHTEHTQRKTRSEQNSPEKRQKVQKKNNSSKNQEENREKQHIGKKDPQPSRDIAIFYLLGYTTQQITTSDRLRCATTHTSGSSDTCSQHVKHQRYRDSATTSQSISSGISFSRSHSYRLMLIDEILRHIHKYKLQFRVVNFLT